MGNNNFLGYVAGAYQNQQQKNREDQELAMRRRQQELAIQNMLENQAMRREENERRKKIDAREDENYEIEKRERDETLGSRKIAPMIRPFVSGMMGDVMDAAGAVGLGGAGVGVALPGDLVTPDFKSRDQVEKQRALEDALNQKRQAKEEAIELEIEKKRRLADEGLIRDYDRFPIGSRSGGQSKKSTGNSVADGSAGGTSLSKTPIVAPTIPAYKPYKNAVDLYARGSDDEKAAFNLRVKELTDSTALSQAEAKNIVLGDLNKIQATNHQNSLAAEQERLRKEKALKAPRKPIGSSGVEDRIGQIIGLPGPQPKQVVEMKGPNGALPTMGDVERPEPSFKAPELKPFVPDTPLPPGIPGGYPSSQNNEFYPQFSPDSFYTTLEENSMKPVQPLPPVLKPPTISVPPGVPGYQPQSAENQFYPQFDPQSLGGVNAQVVYKENPFWDQLERLLERLLFPTNVRQNPYTRP